DGERIVRARKKPVAQINTERTVQSDRAYNSKLPVVCARGRAAEGAIEQGVRRGNVAAVPRQDAPADIHRAGIVEVHIDGRGSGAGGLAKDSGVIKSATKEVT